MILPLAAIPYPPIDPVAFNLGPIAVRWYGLAYVAGFLIGYGWLLRLAKQGMLRLKADAIGDLMTWLIIGVMLGGRLGWWLFYHRPEATPEPWYEVFAFWRGGMSFHGALIGVCLTFLLWSRWHRVAMWNIADAAALVAPVGLFLGRLANFANAELFGRVTNVPWAMIFPGETLPRHPSQLYEALLEGPVLLAIVWLARRLLPQRDGIVASVFILAYGIIRFCVEFTREPDVQLGFIAFGWLTMGQLLSLMLILAGAILLALHLSRTPISPGRTADPRTNGSQPP